MDNIKIDISKDKIYIKKGNIKRRYLYKYWIFMFVLSILLFLGEIKKNDYYYMLLEISFVEFLIGICYLILVATLFLHLTSFGLALYLEIIEYERNINIFTPFYDKKIEIQDIKLIQVTPYYVYKNFRGEGGTFQEYFESKCTVIFKTKEDKEYKWGHTLSYQKGMEIKKIIEDRINLELNKRNE